MLPDDLEAAVSESMMHATDSWMGHYETAWDLAAYGIEDCVMQAQHVAGHDKLRVR